MAEPDSNRYAPPQSAVADEAAAATPAAFPAAFILRWLLAVALVVHGLLRTLGLVLNWRYFADSMIIDPSYNPWPWLALELSVVATGVLLARRSVWLFAPLLLHVGLFLRQVYPELSRSSIGGYIYLNWAGELLVFGFCAWLLLRRGLK